MTADPGEIILMLLQAKNACVENQEYLYEEIHSNPLLLEVGVDLVPLVDKQQGGEVPNGIVSARRLIAAKFGVVLPVVSIRHNIVLAPTEYAIFHLGAKIGGAILHGPFFAIDSREDLGSSHTVVGQPDFEPVSNFAGLWIDPSSCDEASASGYNVVNQAAIIRGV